MKLKKIIGLFLIVLFLFFLVQSVSAQSLIDPGLSEQCKSKEGCTPCDFVQLFVNGSNILVGLSGSFAVLMFIFGGLVLITAYGNEARIKWGKDILAATVVGIFIVLLAWTLINVLTSAVLGVSNPLTQNWYNTHGQCSSQQGGGGLDAETIERIQSLPNF